MRPADPTLPSIAFVLSQAQQAASTSRDSKRRGKFGIRRTKSSPSIAPHPPRYPPELDNEFLKTVDYRFTNPPRAPSRSSFALPKDIFDADTEIEIVVPSLTESESPSVTGSTCSTSSGRGSTRKRTGVVKAFMQDICYGLRTRWHGMQAVRREEHRIPFDLCN